MSTWSSPTWRCPTRATGSRCCSAAREHAPDTPVIVLTAFGNIEGALDSIQQGAFDYLSKPFDVDAIVRVAQRALEQKRLVEENRTLRKQVKQRALVGRSPALLRSTSRWRARRPPTCRC